MTTPSPSSYDTTWYPDSSATHHLTADVANLPTLSDYHGPDQVHVGNGDTLLIKHVGSSVLSTPSFPFIYATC